MYDIALFASGLMLGGLATWLFLSAVKAWKTARGLVKAPSKAKSEYVKKKEKARESVSKGRGQYLRSTIYFLAWLILMGIIATIIFNIM